MNALCAGTDYVLLTTIHPATVANSYRSLRGKVLNFAHHHAQLRSGKECAGPDLRDGDGGGVVRAGRANNDAGRRVEGAGRPDNGAGDTGGGGVA